VSRDAPPSGGRSANWTLVGLVVALVLALVPAAFFLLPNTGTVIVRVFGPSDAHIGQIEVRVDGKVKCGQSPCRIEELAAGEHRFDVSAAGYEQPKARTIALEAGKVAVLEYRLAHE